MIRDQEMMENAWVFASPEMRRAGLRLPTGFAWVIGLLTGAVIMALFAASAFGQTSGRVSGTVKDVTGAVIPQSTVTAANVATGVKQSAIANESGAYSFPLLEIGTYSIEAGSPGFHSEKRDGIRIDVNTSLTIDFSLRVADASQTVMVDAGAVEVETTDTQLGQTVESKQITDIPLNGRSYTDLLAVQPGVSPITTSGAGNSTSGGGFGTVPVAGEENTGQFSIHGQRESDNVFNLNGVSVQETIGQQAGIIPNLDSIAEFRILSSNADAEYGSFTGGIIDVVTKSGTSQFHGSAFEFLRNTDLDARGYFSPERSTFQQSQFGGTSGGPVRKDKMFFFADYQGQRTVQGIETGIVNVPSVANRGGDFTDSVATLTGTVNGPYLAQTLSNRLGYAVTQNEHFYVPGCTSTSQCVFPNAMIPQRAWGNAPTHMLQYIPKPNLGTNEFSSGADKYTIDDNKASGRLDFNSTRYGTSSIYYFNDEYNLDNPFPGGLGGATVPGNGQVFDALSNGVDQTVALSNSRPFGTTLVNEVRFGWTRLDNQIGTPKGGVGTTLGHQGIQSGGEGIVQGYPQQAGVEMMYFNSFAVGTNPFSLGQVNDTYDLSESMIKTLGGHTIKFGGRYTWFKVKQAPNLVANGTYSFFGSGSQSTGNGYADFLLGLPDFYSQQSSPNFYESAADGDLFAQDSFRIRPNLTINYGLRWDYVTPWAEKYHQDHDLCTRRGIADVPRSAAWLSRAGRCSSRWPQDSRGNRTHAARQLFTAHWHCVVAGNIECVSVEAYRWAWKDEYPTRRRAICFIATRVNRGLPNGQSALWAHVYEPGTSCYGDAIHRSSDRNPIHSAIPCSGAALHCFGYAS
jgi:hypothetical protein